MFRCVIIGFAAIGKATVESEAFLGQIASGIAGGALSAVPGLGAPPGVMGMPQSPMPQAAFMGSPGMQMAPPGLPPGTATPAGVPGAPTVAVAAQAGAAADPKNPLANTAADKLNAASKDLKTALKMNPFFKLSGIAMEIRELADANPKALQGAGIFSVKVPSGNETDDEKKKALEQGARDIAYGIDSASAKMKKQEEKQAQAEMEEIKSSGNQEDLQKTMTPQERLQYDNQRIAQIRNDISVNRETMERAKKAIRKSAEAAE